MIVTLAGALSMILQFVVSLYDRCVVVSPLNSYGEIRGPWPCHKRGEKRGGNGERERRERRGGRAEKIQIVQRFTSVNDTRTYITHEFHPWAVQVVYNEFIADKHHVHMNSTKWYTLTDFVKHLGREGKCKVDETPKGWYISLIKTDYTEEIAGQRKAKRERVEKVRPCCINEGAALTTLPGCNYPGGL